MTRQRSIANIIDVFRYCWSTPSTKQPQDSCICNTFHSCCLFPLTDPPWVVPPGTPPPLKSSQTLIYQWLTNFHHSCSLPPTFPSWLLFTLIPFQHTISPVLLCLPVDSPWEWFLFLPFQTRHKLHHFHHCLSLHRCPQPPDLISQIICSLLFLSVTRLSIAAVYSQGLLCPLVLGVLRVL